MSKQRTDLPISDILEVPIDDSYPMADGKRRRSFFQLCSSSSLRFTTVAAFTLAASCLWLSPASGFVYSTPRTSVANSVTNSHQHQIAPFGVQPNERLYGRFFPLYLATGGSSSDKEEWRAILASFQLYKAAYGDMKIPTRFVVPSMKPWPGEFYFFP